LADRVDERDPRAFAWEALLRIEDGAFSDAVLGEGLAGSAMGPRDRALATRLVYGTLAWQGYLDYVLGAFATRPVDRIDPPVRALLRLALLQICRFDRVPGFAAVNTAVELCKRRDRHASGFVNALLRKAAAGWERVPLPDASRDLAGHLAVAWSHPRWMVELWLRELGEADTRALLEANNTDAPTAVRVNSLRGDRATLLAQWRAAGIEAVPSAFSVDGIRLDGGHAGAAMLRGGEAGFSFQGEASQLVGRLVAPQPGERVVDLCAAPGGKACHLAEQMGDRGTVYAVDVAAGGIDRVRREAARLGLGCLTATVADGARWTPEGDELLDRVLVDAPCTGLGTLRQHPEIRWRRTAADVGRNASLQRRLLRHAAALVRPGGVLVYATCTLAAEENDAVVQDLVARGGFRLEPAGPHLGAGCAGLVDASGCLRTLPHRDGLDGFFAARLLRVGPASSVRA
jgi:16S rRNA (cytosine967-C5)-methyltransferase